MFCWSTVEQFSFRLFHASHRSPPLSIASFYHSLRILDVCWIWFVLEASALQHRLEQVSGALASARLAQQASGLGQFTVMFFVLGGGCAAGLIGCCKVRADLGNLGDIRDTSLPSAEGVYA